MMDKDETVEKENPTEKPIEEKNKEQEETFDRPDYEQEIIHILRSTMRPAAQKARLADYHANDIADVLPQLTR